MKEDDWILLSHDGYGSMYNTIYRSACNTMFLKCASSTTGRKKLSLERMFYEYIQSRNIIFPIPRLFSNLCKEDALCMSFLNDYIPLYMQWHTYTKQEQRVIFNRIQNYLDTLHASEQKHISRSEAIRLLHIETFEKIQERFQKVLPLLEEYASVTTVNGVPIDARSFEQLLTKIQIFMQKYIDSLSDSELSLCPLHGDPQFHNIMTHSDGHIIFIDPRGYFGDSYLYGFKEYDDAKLLFALSGYDHFDNLQVTKLDIDDNQNIYLDLDRYITLHDVIWDERYKIARILMISIWMGNAHSFVKTNPLKAVYSYFTALYFGSVFFDDENVMTS